ncbi:twin-arginine translocation protein, TatA/E family subunit [Thermobaculum terrenum ATCC BAA-798]|uniref:Sec-independent protein translocase protein TatA n=1 Tax=Thermobaculum terrenum (strain ATCC BAA-798 / CCMEE 7001 / YNP1) TaxID=525904 RepID=D1CHL2_THET1|nr:twin-arginine translocase TatA/TatE family subunit [Thermobaculum terrenum]ACZ43233.1 twin-arginine translocation protein, TatA/E family subunit [Thermobaculum terrenum ATCC BAA-798]
MFDLGVPELLIILVVAMLIFGVGKLPEIGASLGRSIREFKDTVSGITEMPEEEDRSRPALADSVKQKVEEKVTEVKDAVKEGVEAAKEEASKTS